jgi:capsule polysaccharide export protein KpsE/RkpR
MDGTSEPIDFGKLKKEKKNKKDKSAKEGFRNYLPALHFKTLIAMFFIFIFISSDVFISKVLGNFANATENRMPNTKGVIIQGVFLVLAMIVFQLIVATGFP